MRPERKHPAHGINPEPSEPIIVYNTICTRRRIPWLANASIHEMLRAVWFDASAWLVGRYVIMPDHIHMFAAPGAMNIEYDTWVTYWKRLLALKHGRPEWRFQTDHWDRRLRSSESYSQKWEYVRNNPVRHGLVRDTDDWLFQGELNELQWYE